jgi:hypothetical protein
MHRFSPVVLAALSAPLAVAALAAADFDSTLSLRTDPPTADSSATPPTAIHATSPAEGAVPPPAASSPDSLKIHIEPQLWFVGASGKFKLPVNSGTGPGGFTSEGDKIRVNDLGLDSTRLRPAGTLAATHGPWRFAFSGADFELSRGSIAADVAGRLGSVSFAQGDPLKVELGMGVYEASVGYRVWERDFRACTPASDQCVNAYVFVHAFIGARFYDVNISVESLSGPLARAEEAHLFIEPFIGARAEAVIMDDFSLVVQLSAGGLPLYSTTSLSLDLALAFEWRPVPNIGVEIGWRQLAFGLTDGKELDRFQYNGRLAGLFAAVVIRF